MSNFILAEPQSALIFHKEKISKIKDYLFNLANHLLIPINFVLIVVSFCIATYFPAFDLRLSAPNLGYLVVFYVTDVLYMIGVVVRYCWSHRHTAGTFDVDKKLKATYIVLDISSTIPFELFAMCGFSISGRLSSNEALYTIALLRLNRTLRIYHMYPIYNEFFNKDIGMKGQFTVGILCCLLATVVISIHSGACLNYVAYCGSLSIYWRQQPAHKCSGSVTERYTDSVYWCLLALRRPWLYTSPRSFWSMIWTIYAMIFGRILIFVMLILMIRVLVETELLRSLFFHEAYAVDELLKHFNFPRYATKFVDISFNNMWKMRRRISDHPLKQNLPRSLQMEIGRSMLDQMMDASEIIRALSNYHLEVMCINCKHKHYLSKEFLIRPRTRSQTLYFVVKGIVEVLSDEDHISPILELSTGSVIGELNLIYPSIRPNGVKAYTPCDVLLLHHEDIGTLSSLHPEALRSVRNIIKERIQRAKHGRKATKTLNQDDSRLKFIHPPQTKIDTMKQLGISPDRERPKEAKFLSVLSEPSLQKQLRRKTTELGKYSDLSNILRRRQVSLHPATRKLYKFLSVSGVKKEGCLTSLTARRNSAVFTVWDIFVTAVALVFVMYFLQIMVMKAEKTASTITTICVQLLFIVDLFLRLFIFRKPPRDSEDTLWNHAKVEFSSILFIIVDVVPAIPLIYTIGRIPGIAEYHQRYLLLPMSFKSIKLVLLFVRMESDLRMVLFIVRFSKYAVCMFILLFLLNCFITNATCPHCWDAQNYDYFWHFNGTSFYYATCIVYGILFTQDVDVLSSVDSRRIVAFGGLLSIALALVFIASVISTLCGNSENAVYHHNNLIWLARYLDDELIDLRLIDRVTRYLSIQWRVLLGLTIHKHRTIGFITLSHSIHAELLIEYVADCLYKTHLLKYADADTMRRFCLASNLAVVPPSEVIVFNRDIMANMYVIRRGYVQVYVGESKNPIGVLGPGQSFGELSVFFELPSPVTLQTMTYVELIIIEKGSLDETLIRTTTFTEAIAALKSNNDGVTKCLERLGFGGRLGVLPDSNSVRSTTIKTLGAFIRATTKLDRIQKMPNKSRSTSSEETACGQLLGWSRSCCLMLTPKGKIIRWWEFLFVHAIILVACLVPLTETFPNLRSHASYGLFTYDVIASIDMLIRFRTAYRDFDTNELIIHPLATAKHYLATAFPADFLGNVIPYLVVYFSTLDTRFESSMIIYLLRCNRLILLYRVVGYYNPQNLKIVRGNNTWRFVLVMPVILFCLHLNACIYAIDSCPATESDPNPSPRCLNHSWIVASRPPTPLHKMNETITDIDIYVKCLYYVMTAFTRCYFGEYLTGTVHQREEQTSLLLIYLFVQIYILANLVGRKDQSDNKLLLYQTQMQSLTRFIEKQKLDPEFATRIIKHYFYQWRRNEGLDPQKLFSKLFPSLRREVALDVFEDLMREFPEFRNVPESFLRAICVYLTPIYFLKDDIIVQKDDICDYIYFISRGKVYAGNLAEEATSATAAEKVGACIGMMDVFLEDAIYHHTIIAATDVDALKIKRQHLANVLRTFPQTARTMINAQTKSKSPHIPRDLKDESGSDLRMVAAESSVNLSPSWKRANLTTVVFKEKYEEVEEQGSALQTNLSNLSLIPVSSQTSVQIKTSNNWKPAIEAKWGISKYVELCTFIASVISSIMVTYELSFADRGIAYFVIGYSMDVLFIVRMVLNFEIRDLDEAGELMPNSSEIRNRYLSDLKGFGLDFLSTFPLEVFSFADGKKRPFATGAWFPLRMNRVLRLVHVWLYFKRRTRRLSVNLFWAKVARIVVFTGMYFHFLACVMYGVSTSGDYTPTKNCTGNSEFGWPCKNPERWFQTKIPDSEANSFENNTYLWTIYFVIAIFTTTTYREPVPVTYFEMLFTCFIAVSWLAWVALILADLMSGLHSTLDTSYHHAAKEVMRLYKEYGVSKLVLAKVGRYLEYAWVRNRGVVLPEFLQNAPSSLKMDIYFSLYGTHLKQSYLFCRLPENFLRQISIRFQHSWVLSGDYIVRQGEIHNRRLYFVHTGIVSVSKEEQEEASSTTSGKTFPDSIQIKRSGYLESGSCFGEIQCILGVEPFKYSYKAVGTVDVVTLSPMDLEDVLNIFPEFVMELRERVCDKHNLELLSFS